MSVYITDVSKPKQTESGNAYYTATFAQEADHALATQTSCSRSFFQAANGQWEGVPRENAVEAMNENIDLAGVAEIKTLAIQPVEEVLGTGEVVEFDRRKFVVLVQDESDEDAVKAAGMTLRQTAPQIADLAMDRPAKENGHLAPAE